MERHWEDHDSIENQIHQITTLIQTAARNSIPRTHHITHKKIPREIEELIKLRNQCRRRFQRHRDQNTKADLRNLNSEIRVRLWSFWEEQWHKNIRHAVENKQHLWKFIKSRKMRDNPRSIPALKVQDQIHYTTESKINILADTYKLTNEITTHMSDRETEEAVEESYTHIQVQPTPLEPLTSPNKIKQEVKRLRSGKAPGEDDIQSILLNNLPRKVIAQMYYIYNSCLRLQYFPKSWKNALVIPLKKPNKPNSDPKSYRPISLLPIMGKLLERIILKRLSEHIEGNNIIIPEQFGFIKKKKHLSSTGKSNKSSQGKLELEQSHELNNTRS